MAVSTVQYLLCVSRVLFKIKMRVSDKRGLAPPQLKGLPPNNENLDTCEFRAVATTNMRIWGKPHGHRIGTPNNFGTYRPTQIKRATIHISSECSPKSTWTSWTPRAGVYGSTDGRSRITYVSHKHQATHMNLVILTRVLCAV